MTRLVYALLFPCNPERSHAHRVWITTSRRGPFDFGDACHGFVLGTGDGCGTDNMGCQNGEFRITAWRSLDGNPERFSFVVDRDSSIPDMSALRLNPRKWDPVNSFITVQVKALDGPNNGFIFPAAGQVQTNAYPGTTYGGVVFAYTDSNLRIFAPKNSTGTLIHVPENWGTLGYNQTSNYVEITVKIWNDTGLCDTELITHGKYRRTGHGYCSNDKWVRCLSSCLSDVGCIGIVPCLMDGQCMFLDLFIVNNRIINDTLGNEGEIILVRYDCK